VNYEYVSYPLSTLAPATVRGLANSPTTADSVLRFALPAGSNPNGETLDLRLAGLSAADRRLLYGEFYYNVSGSILVIARKNHLDRWAVDTTQSKNRRIHGLSGLAINKERSDGYQNVTSWGSNPHQQGDEII
jgi:secreted PhoX family phosphatase